MSIKTISVQEPINLKVVRFELDFTSLTPISPRIEKKPKKIKVPRVIRVNNKKQNYIPPPPSNPNQKRNVKELIEELLEEIYSDHRDWGSNSGFDVSRGSTSGASIASSQFNCNEQRDTIERIYLEDLDIHELRELVREGEDRLQANGHRLARCVRARDRLKREQKRICGAFTILLRHITGESAARFSVAPGEGLGEGGYGEWLHAMRLVARLPAGVPQHFRRKLWLTLAERHLTACGIDWPAAERACFRGTALPDDEQLGAQILKDLHRTGCSLFCGTEGRENQAMLRRVLLAYARWNKEVGYCQGFNMIAAIILEVMDKSESDALKVMIYLVEAVLPEGYFADDLRGLSADMAAFRDLLRLRTPRLAHHMDHLQRISDGGGIEPPLPDVFTMQWFLTLYATWLPRESLLRIWDLIMLDGNEILLLTALAIWDVLQDRILSARSADEFYSCMGGGVSAVWEAGDSLVARVVACGPAPELPRLRSLHRYKVAPPAPPAAPVCQPPLHSAMQSMTKRGLRLFYSEDEGDSSDDGNKLALATIIPRREDRLSSGTGDRLSLDIGALKRQYARLRERQRQAHVILAAACARHAAVGVPTSPTSLTVNNLLLGKSAIVSSRGRRLGPPPGAVPPSRQTQHEPRESRSHSRTSDTISWKEEKSRKSLSRRNSVKWRDIKKEKLDLCRKASIDLDEAGDGVIVSELEAKQMIASMRSRSSSETSSYSSHSSSSTDTSLCDDHERGSDSETDLPDDDKPKKKSHKIDKTVVSTPILKESKTLHSPIIKESPLVHSPDQISLVSVDRSAKDISEYLDSAAGEPLRTYIDGFESKLKDSIIVSSSSDVFELNSPFRSLSPYTPRITAVTENEVLERLSTTRYEENSTSRESIRPTNFPVTKSIAELSPINLSHCNYGLAQKSSYEFDYSINFKCLSPSKPDLITRPPDIIDSLTMYPNFVPDIDLSDRNVSDIDSPPRSPGSESIIVSEDEPPIPLKIDKYFEHSPEFFGARVSDPNTPPRRSTERKSRFPKKPDSLNLQTSYNEKLLKEEVERASSLPQSHSFSNIGSSYDVEETDTSCENINHRKEDFATLTEPSTNIFIKESPKIKNQDITEKVKNISESMSPKDYILRSGRKNSERALQIIQENSKILNRILTKQNVIDVFTVRESMQENKNVENQRNIFNSAFPEKPIETKLIESPLLKESTSDSLIGYRKRSAYNESIEKTDFVRVRPISIDDPFSLDIRNISTKNDEFAIKNIKTPSVECLGNKTDLYGWENKGFQAKCEHKSNNIDLDKPNSIYEFDYIKKNSDFSSQGEQSSLELKMATTSDVTHHSISGDLKTSVTLPSTELKDTSSYDLKYSSEDYNYPLSSKYNEYVLSKASDICRKTVDQGPKVCENLLKTDNSQLSDFAHVVTSSISFSYEASAEDDSPIGAKSNSSDTLCQIISLDQVSTPISPKIFPKETLTFPKDYTDKNERNKIESDDTCSTITSLMETETLSSLSYPRSPSTGSYHPFPTRPTMRMPKELGVKLGMYPKDAISSPQK